MHKKLSQKFGLPRSSIPVLRSLDEITGGVSTSLPISQNNDVYTMAQSSCWLDDNHFIVGRWDGTATIFDTSPSQQKAPTLDVVLSPPSHGGVQMLCRAGNGLLWSSNDVQSMAIWSTSTGDWSDLKLAGQASYPLQYGVANCGIACQTASGSWLATGHESGYLLVWDCSNPLVPILKTVVDLRNQNPTNPWGLHNIRGVQLWDMAAGNAFVVTGSENGDICIVSIPTGLVLSRSCYHIGAQRGINTVSVYEDWLLVGNCAVGPNDKNFWAYQIASGGGSVNYTDSTNLVLDTSLPQVFNFSISNGLLSTGSWSWFAATEEGALWMGSLDAKGKISVTGYEEVSAKVGAATAYYDNELVVAAFNVHSFDC
ncbi:MAG: hypothetical protein D8M58_17945 [Calditrichaeota bacterium]|nr:MAG: hypothetical protein DWQ03_01860 [Calditrichota bacterium]MBL1207291.1 hypothetical protein [Calditrichota bacterium]NOG47123.1 hypothetical protein [Calditrichota bacterium]